MSGFDWLLGGVDDSGQKGQILANREAQELIRQKGEAARRDVLSLFPASEANLESGFGSAADIIRKATPTRINAVRQGNENAQETMIQGLIGFKDAILGNDQEWNPESLMRGVKSPQIDLSYLAQAFPDMINTSEIGISPHDTTAPIGGYTTGVNAGLWNQYLEENPDVLEWYNANKETLIAGGDTRFSTPEGYAAWHYNNYGQHEGREAPTSQAHVPEWQRLGYRSERDYNRTVHGTTQPNPSQSSPQPNPQPAPEFGAFQEIVNRFDSGAVDAFQGAREVSNLANAMGMSPQQTAQMLNMDLSEMLSIYDQAGVRY